MKTYIKAALVADSLSLGPHWIYNQTKLARLYPEGVFSLSDPASQYHPNRSAGEFTHYGDQTLWLSRLVESEGSFDASLWRMEWLRSISDYDGYLDDASKQTLANDGNRPSMSNDLAGASRIAPILDLDLPLADAVTAARAQTALTHGDAEVVDSAEFFTRAVYAIREGQSFLAAFEIAASAGSYDSLDASHYLAKAQEASMENPSEAAKQLGLTCHFPEAFPLTLYFTLRPGAKFATAISENGIAGGDTSARAMLLALLFAARDGDEGASLFPQLRVGKESSSSLDLAPGSNPVSFPGPSGRLAGVLELPEAETRGFAIFAHCFTCGKDFLPAARITRRLAKLGIATLRIDFSGIGKSGGTFAESSFLTNLDDLVAAASWLSEHGEAPRLLIGHSLGGTAVLAAATRIESVKAVATIGAPFEPDHVTHLFESQVEAIRNQGEAEVTLAGRPFRIGKKFLDDLDEHEHQSVLGRLNGTDILILHSPTDEVVSIENAGRIYSALRHPKSFISLAGANHLLTREADAEYVAEMISVWALRSLG